MADTPNVPLDKSEDPDYVLVFTMFITIKGKRIYRKDGRPYCFYGKRDREVKP